MKIARGLAIWMGCFLYCCGSGENNRDDFASEQQQDSIVQQTLRAYVEKSWNLKDTLLLKELTSPGFKRSMNGIRVSSTQRELQSNMQVFFKGFPDLEIKITGLAGKDRDRIVEWKAEGTNTGVFGETPATGKKINVSGISWIRFDPDGRMTEEQVYYNELELLQQLGYTLTPPMLE